VTYQVVSKRYGQKALKSALKKYKKVIFTVMNSIETPAKRIHHGRNLKGIRNALDISQDQLAEKLGEAWNQQRISDLENKERIEDELLDKVAQGLNVPVDTIKNYTPEALITFIQNNHSGANASTGLINSGTDFLKNCTFNPFDKFVEQVEKNEKLYQELLKTEREKIALLERLLNEKNK
jgi:transcriptional regulator with XRE-family HTH domain